ncbi:MAG: ATP-binding protein [Thermoprotei archaeon]|nr:MAG: ATP-binding protein [Thermoprotei archaeon]RLF20253.1 MAG: ATP-binding protein [Thermoprotei archaeon]
MLKPIGYIVGESEPTRFTFAVLPDSVPPILEYVCVYVPENIDGARLEVPVLAQVQRIIQRNPLLNEYTSSNAISKLSMTNVGIHQILAEARVLGYSYKGKVRYPRYAPLPGSPVYRAPDDLLRALYQVEPDSAIHIGHLINRPDVDVYLDVRGFSRHVAILAATGAGKSHTAGVIIEGLLKKGATIVAIDPHGDYSRMHEAADGRAFHELSDRITIFSVGPYSIGKTRYYIKVSDLSEDELAYMARIPSSAVNIRFILSLALKRLHEKHVDDKSFDLDELISLLNKWGRGDIEEPYKSRLKGIKDWNKSIFNTIKYLEQLKKLRVFSRSSVPLNHLLKPMHLSVINLTGVPFEAQDIVVYDVLRRIFISRVNAVTNSSGEKFPYPVFIILEEAHRFVPPRRDSSTYSSTIIRTIASEGRKFGVYLIVISQRPSKIDSDVLSQCQSQIVLRIVNPIDQRTISESSEAFSEPLLENLPGLNVGEAVIVGPIVRTPVMVKVKEKRITKHGGMDLPIVSLLKKAREEATMEAQGITEVERARYYITRIRREISGE